MIRYQISANTFGPATAAVSVLLLLLVIQLSGCSKVDEEMSNGVWGSPTADEGSVFQEVPYVYSLEIAKRMERRLAAMERSKSKVPGAVVMNQNQYNQWEIALVEMRIEKNEGYFNTELSPLQPDSIPTFQGLNYYFPNKELNFRAPYKVEPGTDIVKMTKRKGSIVSYLRRGKVSFEYAGKVHTLSIFGPEDTSNGDYLFLPFYDTTSGDETYGGGRYLDVEISPGGYVNLDFNYAYNPLCDYNSIKYNCTLPPEENKLDFAVQAGEKTLYPQSH